MQREKQCAKCGVVKPLDGFYRHKGKADGRNSHCKECKREYQRRYREENRDKVADGKRRYHGENRDKVLEYARRYREENRGILNQGRKIRQAQDKRTSNLLASKKGAPYSPGEDALILCDNGMTVYQKAVELGRTHGSVRTRKRRLRARGAAHV